MNWKEIYEKVLANVCEKEQTDEIIVDTDFSPIQDKLVHNENANENSVFSMKLIDTANEEDYKSFCELVYEYIGLNIYDFLPERKFSKFGK